MVKIKSNDLYIYIIYLHTPPTIRIVCVLIILRVKTYTNVAVDIIQLDIIFFALPVNSIVGSLIASVGNYSPSGTRFLLLSLQEHTRFFYSPCRSTVDSVGFVGPLGRILFYLFSSRFN